MTPDNGAGLDLREPSLWESRRLWSLWDMLKLDAEDFVMAYGTLERLEAWVDSAKIKKDESLTKVMSEKNHAHSKDRMDELVVHLKALNLPVTEIAARRLLERIETKKVTYEKMGQHCADIRSRMLDELRSVNLFFIDQDKAKFFAPKQPLFGADIEAKFPQMSEDIAEAGKSLALDRTTGAVFHLMRVMERGVQKLGDTLGVTLVEEKNWQNILDETNKAIRGLNHKDARTKALAEVSAHLYSVKLAWRNEVMHPKQTYTQDEAESIFNNVRTFIRELATVI